MTSIQRLLAIVDRPGTIASYGALGQKRYVEDTHILDGREVITTDLNSAEETLAQHPDAVVIIHGFKMEVVITLATESQLFKAFDTSNEQYGFTIQDYSVLVERLYGQRLNVPARDNVWPAAWRPQGGESTITLPCALVTFSMDDVASSVDVDEYARLKEHPEKSHPIVGNYARRPAPRLVLGNIEHQPRHIQWYESTFPNGLHQLLNPGDPKASLQEALDALRRGFHRGVSQQLWEAVDGRWAI